MKYVKFEALTVVTMKSTIFWDETLCNLEKLTDVSEECKKGKAIPVTGREGP
jgi:hypothetical protein